MSDERTYDDNGRPCPNCGNSGEGEDLIHDAIRQYRVIEFPGTTVDVAWWCSRCGWEYGFEFSEPSARGDTVEMKPYRVLLEIPRDMLTEVVKLCDEPQDVGKLINDFVNLALRMGPEWQS